MDVCREKGEDAGTLAVPIMFNTQHHSVFLDLSVRTCGKGWPLPESMTPAKSKIPYVC